MWKLPRLLAALFALVLFAAACGSDDTSTAATSGTADSAADDTAMSDTGDGAADNAADDGTMSDSDAGTAGNNAADDGAMSDDMNDEHGADAHGEHGDDHGHSHGTGLEVADGVPVPEIAVDVQPDPKSGYNLQVSLDNFVITPENASTPPVDGEGHLHLYVDGERVMRFYNEWLHLSLEPGSRLVEVEVSANNHSPYTVDGERILGSAVVEVPEPDEGGHSHSHATTIDVEASTAPTVEVSVFEDPKAGWNIHADLANFVLTPANASTEHIDGEGHLHLYVDGQKVTRLYGSWWHVRALDEGTHTIEVEVSANDHSAYAIDGEPIRGRVEIEVDGEAATPSDADVEFAATFADGSVTTDVGDRVEVELGSVVAISVESDVAEEIHLHGYDVLVDIEPGGSAILRFTADVPGRFEIEFERSGEFIAELEVS